METKKSINFEQDTKVFFEATFIKKKTGYTHSVTRNTIRELQLAIEAFIRDGDYELKTANEVTRVIPRLIVG